MEYWNTHTCLCLALLCLLRVGRAPAQPVPADRELLENGSGAGMAAYADPADFPGPRHILDLADTLALTENQIKQIEAISDDMGAQARALGIRIIEQEELLESLFRNGNAGEEETRNIATSIGTLRGRLRAVYLTAHIEARDVLTAGQRQLYTELRYGIRK